MSAQWDYYSMVGFAPETATPEDLERLTLEADDTALFLDFDGTLVDIAPTPDAIIVDRQVRSLLGHLLKHHRGAVAIVSGRNLSEIESHLGEFRGTISGGHGAEIRHLSEYLPGVQCDLVRLDHVKNAVREFAVLEPRLLVEDKSFGIVLHFRQHPDLECRVREYLASLLGGDEEFELQSAKMAIEVKPKGTSKADAVSRIARFEQFSGRRILFAGDDDTDESAFSWVNEHDGITIKIGDGPTCARYRTHSPASFKAWLRRQAAAPMVC